MKIVVAPQALKGSLDAAAAGTAIATGIHAVFPAAEVVVISVADGGEGTVQAMVSATQGQLLQVDVRGPLGTPIAAHYGILGTTSTSEQSRHKRTAVIEMAAASGLPLLAPEQRDLRLATSYGTGELLRAALDADCQRVIIGIGGSATSDGGAGMAQALGARLLDAKGVELPVGGAALAQLASIDTSALDPRLQATEVLVACDVSNPLYGPEGALAIYGPQKGATPEMIHELEAALRHYADVLQRDLDVDVASIPGAGAAGGLGAGLLAFAQATLVPGARLILDTLDFASVVQGADLVVTAEGRLDAQTAYGKAVSEVARIGRQAGAHVIALVGTLAATDEQLSTLGIEAALPICDGPMTLAESMAHAAELLSTTAMHAMRLIALGQTLTN